MAMRDNTLLPTLTQSAAVELQGTILKIAQKVSAQNIIIFCKIEQHFFVNFVKDHET